MDARHLGGAGLEPHSARPTGGSSPTTFAEHFTQLCHGERLEPRSAHGDTRRPLVAPRPHGYALPALAAKATYLLAVVVPGVTGSPSVMNRKLSRITSES